MASSEAASAGPSEGRRTRSQTRNKTGDQTRGVSKKRSESHDRSPSPHQRAKRLKNTLGSIAEGSGDAESGDVQGMEVDKPPEAGEPLVEQLDANTPIPTTESDPPPTRGTGLSTGDVRQSHGPTGNEDGSSDLDAEEGDLPNDFDKPPPSSTTKRSGETNADAKFTSVGFWKSNGTKQIRQYGPKQQAVYSAVPVSDCWDDIQQQEKLNDPHPWNGGKQPSEKFRMPAIALPPGCGILDIIPAERYSRPDKNMKPVLMQVKWSDGSYSWQTKSSMRKPLKDRWLTLDQDLVFQGKTYLPRGFQIRKVNLACLKVYIRNNNAYENWKRKSDKEKAEQRQRSPSVTLDENLNEAQNPSAGG